MQSFEVTTYWREVVKLPSVLNWELNLLTSLLKFMRMVMMLPNSFKRFQILVFYPKHQRSTFLSFFLESETKDGWWLYHVASTWWKILASFVHAKFDPHFRIIINRTSCPQFSLMGRVVSGPTSEIYVLTRFVKCRFRITESFALQIYFLTNTTFVLMSIIGILEPQIF